MTGTQNTLGSNTLAKFLPILQCPRTRSALSLDNGILKTSGGECSYSLHEGVPDLRVAPSKLQISAPWYEPWEDLDSVLLAEPDITIDTTNLPYHLDKYLASIPGNNGDGKSIIEVGCGERQCEQWFSSRGFQYVGADVDVRGNGPHFLADAHNLPFKDGSFDFYTSMAVYEHLVSPITAAQEAFRVLKPGGVFFGSSAFVYCFHDRASFHHMSHAGLLYVLNVAGFKVERMWPDWDYHDAIPQMGFRGRVGAPWRFLLGSTIRFSEWSFVGLSDMARKLIGKPRINRFERRLHTAGSVSFLARRQ